MEIKKRREPFFICPVALDDSGLDPFEIRAYLRIVRRSSGEHDCYERIGNMAEACLMSRRKFEQCLNALEALNMIKRTKNERNDVSISVTESFTWKVQTPAVRMKHDFSEQNQHTDAHVVRSDAHVVRSDAHVVRSDAHMTTKNSTPYAPDAQALTHEVRKPYAPDAQALIYNKKIKNIRRSNSEEGRENVETRFDAFSSDEISSEIVSEEIASEVCSSEFMEAEIVDEKLKRKKKAVETSDHDRDLGHRWYEWTTKLSPHINATPASFSAAIFETKRALARTIPDGDLNALIDAIFDFIQRDDFWSKNCLSPGGLLKKSSNCLRKVDNIITAMRKSEFKSKRKELLLETEEATDWSKYV